MTPLSTLDLRAARRGSSVLLLVAVTLLLVASTLLTPPAEAARRKQAATQVTGWSTDQVVTEGSAVVWFRATVRPGQRRQVSLEWRPDAATGWKTLVRSRADRRGRVSLGMRPTAGTLSEVRLSVKGSRRAAGIATAPRSVRALAPGQSAAVSTTATLGEFEAEVLRLTNDRRSRPQVCGGTSFAAAPPVRAEGALTNASRAHSQRMGSQGFFSHTDPDGRSPMQRANAAGHYANGIGENIAMGQTSPAQVVDAWMRSEGHCANIMGPRWTEMGIGYRVVQGSPGTHYWTQMFSTGAVRR